MPQRVVRIVSTAAAAAAGLVLTLGYAIAAILGWTTAQVLGNGLVGIPVLAITSAVCGAVLVWHRPANVVGHLLIGNGLVAAVTAASIPAVALAARDGWAWSTRVLIANVAMTSWSIWLIFIPLVVLAFPFGRIAGTAARVLAVLVVAVGTATLLLLLADPRLGAGLAVFGLDPADPLLTEPIGLLAGTPLAAWSGAITVTGAVSGLLTVAALVLLVVRFARGDARLRRQVLWVLFAVLLIIVIVAVGALPTLLGPELGAPLVPAVFALLPVAIIIAIVRADLFDIGRVFSRTLAWTILSGLVAIGYLVLVAMLGTFLVETASAVVAALAVALAFEPLRRLLQRGVDRLVLGRRMGAAEIIELVGAGIAEEVELAAILRRLAEAFALDWLAVRTDAKLHASTGERTPLLIEIPLQYGDRMIGVLEVGASDRLEPGRTERRFLELVAPVLAALVRLAALRDELADSRAEVVRGAEEERRRVQRDLHDGVASALSGIAFKLEAIRNRAVDPEAAEATVAALGEVHGDVVRVGRSLRAVLDDLAPPELQSLGLVDAIRQSVGVIAARAGRERSVRVTVPDGLDLPAAIEVAAYRIVAEAVANAIRHGDAAEVAVTLRRTKDSLGILVEDRRDDDARRPGAWTPGIGLRSMRERAELLGGSFAAGPTATGGAVRIALPVGSER